MQTFWQDIRYGLRLLWQKPGFTAVTVLALALGIGANTATFSVVNAVLLRPLPFKNADRLVYVWETNLKSGVERDIASPPNFADWRAGNHVFEQLSAWRTWFYRLSGDGEPEQVWGVRTSANFFDLLKVAPLRGRAFLPEEEQPGRDRVVIISDGLWARRFGADPHLIGQPITIDDQAFTVIGILPPDFNLFGTRRPYDLWMPYAFEQSQPKRDDYSVIVFGRLKPKVTLDQAQTEMSAIAERFEREYPATNQNRGVKIVTLQENQASRLRPALLVLLVAVGFVLLIACANVANLLLARAATRQQEIAIRLALGAGRLRLIRQLLAENMLLASLGGAVGLLLAWWDLDLLRAILPTSGVDEIPRADWIGLDTTVLSFTLLLSLLTGIIFGLGPALHLSHPNLSDALKEGGKNSGAGARSRRLRNVLVVAEVALAMVLLFGAGLMIRSFSKLAEVNPGLNPENVLTMQVWLPESKYPDRARVADFYQQTLERIRTLPGVQTASAINFLPLSGWGDSTGFAIEGRAAPRPGQELSAQYRVIDADYFRAMGIPLLQGRAFTEHDRDEANGVTLINETMARRYWPQENPIGQRLQPAFPQTKTPWRPAASNTWLTVVGVVGDVKEASLIDEPQPEFYLPQWQNPSALMRLVIRTTAEPASFIPAIRHAVLAVDKDQPITEIISLRKLIAESVFRRRFNMLLLGVFATVALMLAAVGIYGVMSYTVSQRTHEIGLRLALGAQAKDVLKLVVGQGLQLVMLGLMIGGLASLALMRLMSNLLYGVSATDPVTFVVIALLLAGVALLACYLPARRAMKVEPMAALRYE